MARSCLGLLALVCADGCSIEATPRAQLVVVVDIDVPVPEQVALDPDLSGDSAVDTLRVEAFLGEGWSSPFDLRDFVAPSPDDWPVSFGVAATEVAYDRPVHLRLRAFGGRRATAGVLDGKATIDPPSDVTIDRLVELAAPEEGVARVQITLHGDCLGVFNTFDPDPKKVRTCIDGTRMQGLPTDGMVAHADQASLPTQAGSWSGARAVPCGGAAPASVDAVCIPGGFSVIGELAFDGLGDGIYNLDPAPLRPVVLSPFFMDRTEVTVGMFRQLLQDPAAHLDGVAPVLQGEPSVGDSEFCTWLGPNEGADDALPLNCLRRQDTEAICAARGGQVPSEAQWEHAARGRGQGRLYPWGDHEPGQETCCLTSVAREPSVNSAPAPCPGRGVEPAGSHAASQACAGLGDESRDGVLDLAGSLSELTADSFRPYDAVCWRRGTGALHDPVCVDDATVDRVTRGGNWNSGLSSGAAPMRRSFNGQRPSTGVRCVYPDGAP